VLSDEVRAGIAQNLRTTLMGDRVACDPMVMRRYDQKPHVAAGGESISAGCVSLGHR
jgi:hypothetical protein